VVEALWNDLVTTDSLCAKSVLGLEIHVGSDSSGRLPC